MIVKTIEIKNFKAISNVAFNLEEVNVIVGPNNSGKSSALQAIHLASTLFRQAYEANKPSSLSLIDLEYIPSEDYRQLGQNTIWGNVAGTPESQVLFKFDDDEEERQASIIVKSARNEGLSLKPRLDPELISTLRSRDSVFTAYIPGISGIPVKEERISRLHVYRKAASGDSNVVLRNILNILQSNNQLSELQDMVNAVYEGTTIRVDFDEDKNYYINAETRSGETFKPLEFSGTGLLQVLQVLSYLVLFRPSLLLIDEPESHLHPTLQTRLVRVLQSISAEQGSRIILTTHSPYVVRGLGANARMIWLKRGKLIADSRGSEMRAALGWGAMDKKVLFITEDKNAKQLEKVVRQEPSIDDRVAIVPFEGVTKLGTATGIVNLRAALGNQHKVIVHRDRDCHLDSELKKWRHEYESRGIAVWVTEGSDIESLFCDPDFISLQEGLPISEARALFAEIIEEGADDFYAEFCGKRQNINKLYEKTGGSPAFDDLWEKMDVFEKVKGKSLISAWRRKLTERGLMQKNPTDDWKGYLLAPRLMKKLRDVAF